MKLTLPWSATESHANGISDKLDEVRRALGDQSDYLSVVASQLGQDLTKQATKATEEAGNQTSVLVRDVSSSAGALAKHMSRRAASLGAVIAARGRQGATRMGKDVKSLGADLRKMRITTEPKKSGPDMMPGVALLGGFGAGLALMYFADPEQGSRRRALVRDKVTAWTRAGRETATDKAKEFRNRTVGVMQDTRKALSGAAGEADDKLTEAIESEPASHQAPWDNGAASLQQASDRVLNETSRVG